MVLSIYINYANAPKWIWYISKQDKQAVNWPCVRVLPAFFSPHDRALNHPPSFFFSSCCRDAAPQDGVHSGHRGLRPALAGPTPSAHYRQWPLCQLLLPWQPGGFPLRLSWLAPVAWWVCVCVEASGGWRMNPVRECRSLTFCVFPQNMSQPPVPEWMLCVHMVTQEKPSDWPSPWWTRYDGNSRGSWSTSVGTRKVNFINIIIGSLLVSEYKNKHKHTILTSSLIINTKLVYYYSLSSQNQGKAERKKRRWSCQ